MIKEDKKIEKKYLRKLFRILKKETFYYKERCDKRREKYIKLENRREDGGSDR